MLGILKRCPFCRSPNSDVIECDVASWAVTCAACGAIGPVGASTGEAMERWNAARDECDSGRGGNDAAPAKA